MKKRAFFHRKPERTFGSLGTEKAMLFRVLYEEQAIASSADEKTKQ